MSHLQAVRFAFHHEGQEGATEYLNRELKRCGDAIDQIRKVAKGKDWTQSQRNQYVTEKTAPLLTEIDELEGIRQRYIDKA